MQKRTRKEGVTPKKGEEFDSIISLAREEMGEIYEEGTTLVEQNIWGIVYPNQIAMDSLEGKEFVPHDLLL